MWGEISSEKMEHMGNSFDNFLDMGERVLCWDCAARERGIDREGWLKFVEIKQRIELDLMHFEDVVFEMVVDGLRECGAACDGEGVRLGWRGLGTRDQLFEFVWDRLLERAERLATTIVGDYLKECGVGAKPGEGGKR